ncbi:uncharacterized protein TNCV_922661 [Trichonephila clavipes]|nr:uncharacterized protein TNCV_922661 [Trichonephila clavipes]
MITIHNRLNDPFYLVMVYSQTFADFLTQYVLNCPVDTLIEIQGCNEDYCIIKAEFIWTEKGFPYNKEFKHGNADVAHAVMLNYVSEENIWTVTPEAWLDIVIQSYMIKFPMLKRQTPLQTIIHIWTTRAFYNRLWYSELFSTVAYLEMKRTRNPAVYFQVDDRVDPGNRPAVVSSEKTRLSSYGVLLSPAKLGYGINRCRIFLQFLINGAVI